MPKPNDFDTTLMNYVYAYYFNNVSFAFTKIGKAITVGLLSKFIKLATSCIVLYISLIVSIVIYAFMPNNDFFILQLLLHAWIQVIIFRNCKYINYFYPFYISLSGSLAFAIGDILGELWLIILGIIFLISSAILNLIFKQNFTKLLD